MDRRVAWAAGLFEGEGSFHLRRMRENRRSVHLHAALVTTDHDVILRFAEVVGVGRLGDVRQRRPHHKQQWAWRANGSDVELLYELIGPWLGERRQRRYAEILAERREYERDRDRYAHKFPRYAYTQGRLP